MKRKTVERPPSNSSTRVEELVPGAPARVWSPLLRISFRFAFVYFGLFCLATQIAGSLFQLPASPFRGFGLLWPMRPITFWVAEHIFGVTEPLVYGRNSGETLFFWVQTLWLLVFSLLATATWSFVDRRRQNYVTLHKWFRLF